MTVPHDICDECGACNADHGPHTCDLPRCNGNHRPKSYLVGMPIDAWRLLLTQLQQVGWAHAPFQEAVSSLQVQVSRYREPSA